DCTKPSGATFPLGTTPVTCTATDASGNHSSPASFNVIVQDTTNPTITAPADITAEATSSNGAVVNPGQATASDIAGAVTIAGPATGQYPLGTTTVTWTATDQSGNHASATQQIKVVDTTPPTVATPAAANPNPVTGLTTN